MWESSAPSNIALIKYMGKKGEGNQPINPSLSWTLDYLRSFVQIEPHSGGEDIWESHPQFPDLALTEFGRQKFLNHLKNLKQHFGLENHHFVVRSGNNFPSDCGIASSASSFAALTMAAVKALESFHATKKLSLAEQAQWSRQGSGSSCRSFFPGFVEWTENNIGPLETRMKSLLHMVVIASESVKKVSSSQAHKAVTSSSLLRGRSARAEERFEVLKKELLNFPCNWQKIFEITWAEFWDMHALFETSEPPFGYMSADSLKVVTLAREFWEQNKDGPVVTMDAGPNVHLLWRSEQKEKAIEFRKLLGDVKVLSNIGEIS